MSDLMNAADQLAETNDKLVASGRRLTQHEQLIQARRHTFWAARWTELSMSIAEPDSDLVLSDAAQAIRKARILIDEALG